MSHLVSVYAQYPMPLERAEGVYCYDSNGNQYLDFYGGHCVCGVGHSRKEVAQAIAKQAEKFMFYSNLAHIPLREQAAEKLVNFANNGLEKVFFTNTGAEGNENAMKIAIKLTARQKIVSYTGSFHGRSLLAVNATDKKEWHDYLHSRIKDVTRIKPNDEEGLKEIDKDTACVILEPIQSIGGVTVFTEAYLKKLRLACDKVGALIIFDEVQTGMGRTGVPFVSGHCGIKPDMMSLAKSLANGFPMGALVMTKEVASGLKTGDLGATFGGGPMALAAMMATIDCILKDNLMQNVVSIENYAKNKFTSPQVEEVRGKGCLLGVVMKNQEAKAIQQNLFNKKIIVGLNSNPKLVHLLPPMIIQNEHIDRLLEGMEI